MAEIEELATAGVGLTVAKLREAYRIIAEYENCDSLPVSANQMHAIVVGAYQAGAVDRWEAWAQLYNLGFRGRDLAHLYRG